jgi:predicted  nucleic acid-binding Zn-ribbon protein
VKVTGSDLENLVNLYGQETLLKKARLEHARLSSGEHLVEAHEEILRVAGEVSNQRALVEDAERELQRTAADLELVENRIAKDLERLNQSSNPKDIQGIQHEMDTLARRKDELETTELEIMENIDDVRSKLEQLLEHKRVLETQLEAEKASTKTSIDELGGQILEMENTVGKLRSGAPQDVLAIYDQRATRGVPIGKLLTSTCGACNMSLTSTAMNDLHKVPADELARCPECTAILVRS